LAPARVRPPVQDQTLRFVVPAPFWITPPKIEVVATSL
jgi:hypothetical protein